MSTDISLLKGIKLYGEKEFDGLSQTQKEKHCDYIISKMLENSGEGVIVSQVKSLIPYMKNEKTIQRYLDKLVNTNIAYKKLIGRTYIYQLNGKLLHEALKENVPAGDKLYSFYHIKNPDGEFIFIQEKKIGEFKDVSVTGGILIKSQYLKNLIENLVDINKKVININTH